ncbi:hypothetical protein R1flu_011362 [Riccia fluitans]|uniref:Uncharacterized protein n=1 Tax=Riccia fluitans TaxID=41844 RepID=A0ABD1Z8E1_9MARC
MCLLHLADHDDMLDIRRELLKSKQLKRSLLLMSKRDCRMLIGNREGRLNEMNLEFKVVPNTTMIKYVAIINEARMKLLAQRKEVRCVCYAFADHDDTLEVWWELLKSKQLKISLLPMSKLDCWILIGNQEGGLNE